MLTSLKLNGKKLYGRGILKLSLLFIQMIWKDYYHQWEYEIIYKICLSYRMRIRLLKVNVNPNMEARVRVGANTSDSHW